MSKVKKAAHKMVVRNAKAKRAAKKRPVRKASDEKTQLAARFDVKELDPQRKCGAGTSVQRLYRLTERSPPPSITHLVFFDRHGWYCEHGRQCPAVGHARKYGRHT